jgi:hypothetical protein
LDSSERAKDILQQTGTEDIASPVAARSKLGLCASIAAEGWLKQTNYRHA